MDLLSFLEKGNFADLLLKSKRWPGPVRARMIAKEGWRRGVFSFQEMVQLMLTDAFRAKTVKQKFAAYINERTRDAITPFINHDGSVTLFGNDFFPALGSYYELIDLIHQIVIEDQYQIRRFLKPDSVVIDAGANIGTFSITAAHHAPRGKVYAFEPAPGTFSVLQKNTAPYPDISCFQMGLGDEDALKKFVIYKHTAGANFFEDSVISWDRREENIDRTETAQITSIDAFVKNKHVSRLDFIKIDTEGYEAKVLEGGRDTIKKYQPVIAMSAYHKAEDKEVLPGIIRSISDDYSYELYRGSEEDFIFYPKHFSPQ